MDYFNAFGNCPGSTVLCKGYPPGMALWEYFIGKLYGGFFEGHVYQARGWLLAVLFLPIAKSFTWRQCIYAGMSVIFILMCPFIFNESYLTTLYVDAVLGILFGYILSVGFLEKERNCFLFSSDKEWYFSIISDISISFLFKSFIGSGLLVRFNK